MGASISIQANTKDFTRAALFRKKKISHDVEVATYATGFQMFDSMVRHASGRPGPNVVSGEFVSNLFLEFHHRGDITAFSVGSPSVQAARLEFGFVGVDALGRHYQQPEYPFILPAVEEVWPYFVQRMLLASIGELT